MVLSSVVFNKPLRPLRKTYDGWIRILKKSDYGCKNKSWKYNSLFLTKFLWFIINKILFNLSIFKLKIVVLAPTEDIFLFHFTWPCLRKVCLQCLLLPWVWPTVMALQCKPKCPVPCHREAKGLLLISYFSPAACKPLCLLCWTLIHVSSRPWLVRHVCSKCLDR